MGGSGDQNEVAMGAMTYTTVLQRPSDPSTGPALSDFRSDTLSSEDLAALGHTVSCSQT